ncbi:MAG TPA: hypothetical protein VGV38_21600 [Pyrinomonadaceae bacterium]|nr:hypothetical protein [Pyrinomonadaceae bacterium]
MSRQIDEEGLLRNYLMGDLDEATREQVEERLLGDDGFAERLSAAQDALLDDYVFGTLAPGERESFDRNFVFDEERHRKLTFARALKIYVDEHGPPSPERRDSRPTPPAWKKPLTFIQAHKTGAAVTAAALLLLLLAPPLLRRLRTPDPADLLRERRAAVERRVAEFNKRPADPNVKALPSAELALLRTLRREDGTMPRVVLTDDIKLLTLKLPLPEERHENYSALVLTVEGDELFAVPNLTPRLDAGGATVPLSIPADVLKTGDYQVLLRAAVGGSPEVGRYNFRVITQK